MDRRSIAAVLCACLVLLAGCSGLLADGGDSPNGGPAPGETEASGQTTTTPSATETADTSTPPRQTDTETATSTSPGTPTPRKWSAPEQPNGPLQRSLDESQGNRISTVEQVAQNGSGGTVTLEVAANTSMASVDPPEHGTVRGEPYFLVYVDGQFEDAGSWSGSNFSTVNGTLVERVDSVAQRANGTFDLAVSQAGFEAADAEAGEVDLLVLLLDEDKQWDDIYGVQRITVEYSPEE